MILDLDHRGPPHLEGAVAVVGAGAAGIAIALALGKAGRPVLLLEAGGDVVDPRTNAAAPGDVHAAAPWTPDDATERPFRLEDGRASGLGGTAELWHGQCTRLHAEDLETRSWVGLGWPIDPEELATAYDAAEEWFELSGHGYSAERWTEYPQLQPPAWASERLRHDFTEYAPDYLLGQRFRRALADSALVHVLMHARVSRIELNGSGEVIALSLLDSSRNESRLEVGEVVLAAGAIENARLLQLSDPDGIGLGTGRWHTGRWLQDHPVVRLGEVVADDPTRLQDCYTGLHGPGGQLFPKIRLAPEVQADEQLLDATAILNHDIDTAPVDALRRLAKHDTSTLSTDLRTIARNARALARALWRRYRHGLSSGLTAEHVWLDVWLEQKPSAESRVTLSTTEHANDGLPASVVSWHVGELERRTSRRLGQIVAEELARLGIGKFHPLPADDDDEAWQASVVDAFHPAGTTRMSVDPTQGVVDPDLQVHGVTGLSVVGGSVFPTSGYANPTLTIVALALRLAKRLSPVGSTVA